MKKTYSIGILLGICITLAVLLAGHKVSEFKSTLDFCATSCHSMSTVAEEYKQSIHYQNASGVRATCYDCHMPADTIDKTVRTIKSVHELIGEIKETIATPELFEEHRLRLAKASWKTFEDTKSSACKQCHSYEAMDFEKQHNPAGMTQMQSAALEDQNCVSCHKGIAHKMPDLEAENRRIQEEKMAQLKNATETYDEPTLWLKQTTNLYAESSTDSLKIGSILPMTEVYNLGVKGDFVKIKTVGWKAGKAARGQYASFGERILNVSIRKKGIDQVKYGETKFFSDGNQDWQQSEIVGYVEKSALTGKYDLLAVVADNLYQTQCGACHSTHELSSKSSLEWQEAVLSYVDKTGLTKEEARMMTRFLQINGNSFKREL